MSIASLIIVLLLSLAALIAAGAVISAGSTAARNRDPSGRFRSLEKTIDGRRRS
jgi:hypothetical protein